MSNNKQRIFNKIEAFDESQIAEFLEVNGLQEFAQVIQIKRIDGSQFLQIQEYQILLWRPHITASQAKKLWAFITQFKEHPEQFLVHKIQFQPPPNITQQQLANLCKDDQVINQLQNMLRDRDIQQEVIHQDSSDFQEESFSSEEWEEDYVDQSVTHLPKFQCQKHEHQASDSDVEEIYENTSSKPKPTWGKQKGASSQIEDEAEDVYENTSEATKFQPQISTASSTPNRQNESKVEQRSATSFKNKVPLQVEDEEISIYENSSSKSSNLNEAKLNKLQSTLPRPIISKKPSEGFHLQKNKAASTKSPPTATQQKNDSDHLFPHRQLPQSKITQFSTSRSHLESSKTTVKTFEPNAIDKNDESENEDNINVNVTTGKTDFSDEKYPNSDGVNILIKEKSLKIKEETLLKSSPTLTRPNDLKKPKVELPPPPIQYHRSPQLPPTLQTTKIKIKPLPPTPSNDEKHPPLPLRNTKPELKAAAKATVNNFFAARSHLEAVLSSSKIMSKKSEPLEEYLEPNEVETVEDDVYEPEPNCPRYPRKIEQIPINKIQSRALPKPPDQADQIRTLPRPPKNVPSFNDTITSLEKNTLQSLSCFRYTTRKGSEMLLTETLGDGAYLLRPSKQFHCTLSVRCESKIYHIGIKQTSDGKLECLSSGRPMLFDNLKDICEHFKINTLKLMDNYHNYKFVLLRDVLPKNMK